MVKHLFFTVFCKDHRLRSRERSRDVDTWRYSAIIAMNLSYLTFSYVWWILWMVLERLGRWQNFHIFHILQYNPIKYKSTCIWRLSLSLEVPRLWNRPIMYWEWLSVSDAQFWKFRIPIPGKPRKSDAKFPIALFHSGMSPGIVHHCL